MKHNKQERFDENILDPKNQKVRVNIWLDGDVLQAIKAQALKEDGPNAKYQSFLNRFLRRAFLEGEESVISLLKEIKEKLNAS